jgi:tetratricopeptide (TPR) repeat protein
MPPAESDETRLGDTLLPAHTAAHGPLSIGQPFGNRYRILRLLGAGGMGVVYQAWDEELGVAVALKVIRPEVMSDPYSARDVERRFKRELLLARQVTHRNVVRIHDLGEIDGIKYITMPFVAGENLASLLRDEGRLPLPRVLHIAREVAAGLAAAHEAGVVHRDLKPENIMITEEGHALIMDFGISRSLGGGTGTGTALGAVVGTLEYMAPEQGRGEAVDHRADIYAFGLILYDTIAGRRRLEMTESAIAEMMSRFTKPPAPLRQKDPHVPEPVERIVSRCLEPDAEKRYPTTVELVADLEALDAQGNRVVVRRPRSWRLAIAAAVIAMLLLSALVVWRTRPVATVAVVTQAPISVLIGDFENQAGDAVFDGALEQALAIAMEDAPFISVFPRRDALASAAQTGSDAGGKLNRDVGLRVARREGLNYLVSGRIVKTAGGYELTVDAFDAPAEASGATATGTPKFTITKEIPGKAKVLAGIGEAAADVLRRFGNEGPPTRPPFADETFTAASLEAMNAYARGQDLSLAGKPLEALEAYTEAIRVDETFGRAYSGMAVIYGNLKRAGESEASYKAAFTHLSKMTEREQYRTLGAYYLLVARNYEKAAENFEMLVSKYPADNAGHANLAIAYLQLRKVPLAMEEGRKAIEIYPRNLLQRTNYSMYAMYAGDFATATAEAMKVLEVNPKLDFAMLTLGRAQLAAGDVAAARESYARLAGVGAVGASQAALGLADLEMYLGRYKEAIPILERGIAADEKAGNQYDLAVKLVALAEAHAALGETQVAAIAARRAVRIGGHESVLFPAGRVLLEAGHYGDVPSIVKALENMLQTQTTAYARLLAGDLAIRRGRHSEGIQHLRDAQQRHDAWFARYLLGRAYLDADRPAEALTEFGECVKRKGEALDAFIADASTLRYYPAAVYWHGRAQDVLGVAKDARASYAEYLKIRAAATSPDPLAAEAAKRSGS